MKLSSSEDSKFFEFEKKCLLLDILIDCEEYDEFKKVLKKSKDIFDNIVIDIKDDKAEDAIKNQFENIEHDDINSRSKIIIISKYTRNLIKKNESKLDSKKVKSLFKILTEKLLKRIPELNRESEEHNWDNHFRIIFLNEISACNESDLSVGYAEIALNELKELNTKWNLKKDTDERIKHPYELYALYNMGLTYAHNHRDADKAIEKLSQITQLFEKDDQISIKEKFRNEYSEFVELFPICFWFFYVPSKYLIAEAYSDSSSSYNLEDTIDKARKTIRCTNIEEIDLDCSDSTLTEKIKNYQLIKFDIQQIFSTIDKRDKIIFEDEVRDKSGSNGWLKNFDKILSEKTLASISDYIKNIKNEYRTTSIIKNQIDAAGALFYLELAKRDQEKSNKCVITSFKICKRHLQDQTGPDWSDFAITFLEGIIFAATQDKDDLLSEVIGKYKNTYNRIFIKIIDGEWIPRKKELVEKFISCQDKILNSHMMNGSDNVFIFIRYQIELIYNILDEDKENNFNKKWPDCEKEKLVKNLKEIIRNEQDELDSCDVLNWWENNKSKFSDKRDNEWERDFDSIIKKMQIKLRDELYNAPEDIWSVADFIHENMNCDYYIKMIRQNTEQFYDHLIYQSCRPSLYDCYALTVLRRWQSFTPALSMGSEVGHKGGGYFVYKTNHKGEIEEGLVIDPGFDFLENFFEESFSIRDINAILITHSHRDHASDFMSIVTLVHEMNEKGKRIFRNGQWMERKLVLLIAEGCYQFYAEQIRRYKDSFQDVIRMKQNSLEGNDKQKLFKYFRLKATKANHYDQSDHDSVGYLIKDNIGNELIGFTGDTRWYNNIEQAYIKYPVICMNLGAVVDIFKKPEIMLSDLCNKNDDKQIKKIKQILLRENHLYLPGFYLMARKFYKDKQKLLILSELCEEMKGGLRTDLSEKLTKKLDVPVLPEDIGLTVILNTIKKGYVLCRACNTAKRPDHIVPVETDKDSAIVYLCKDHYNQLKESYILPQINKLEMDVNELRKPLINKNIPFVKHVIRKILK